MSYSGRQFEKLRKKHGSHKCQRCKKKCKPRWHKYLHGLFCAVCQEVLKKLRKERQ